ncbi:MAG: chemotaxis protein CheW [Thiohalobacteraceae bacterium]
MSDRLPPIETATEQRGMLDQQLALGVYLQALLRPPEPVVTQAAPTMDLLAPPVNLDTTVNKVSQAAVKEEQECAVSPAAEGGRPDWVTPQFQCLLFEVAGLTLAVPLARLGGVLPWDGAAVNEMPNHQPWFLGLRTHQGRKVKLIDVARLVLPADRHADLAPADSGRLGKVVLLDDAEWGLACDAVSEVISLSDTDVKWRTTPGTRPWLAGTVIKQMCALIDTQAFADMLNSRPGTA